VPYLTVNDGTETMTLPLKALGNDRYRATFYPASAGRFTFSAGVGELAASETAVMGYPMALRPQSPDLALRALAGLTGGSIDGTPQSTATADRWAIAPFARGWLLMALALFMLELAVRYTGLIPARRNAPTAPRGRPTSSAARTPQRQPEPAE
jgi:hypothetical protein